MYFFKYDYENEKPLFVKVTLPFIFMNERGGVISRRLNTKKREVNSKYY